MPNSTYEANRADSEYIDTLIRSMVDDLNTMTSLRETILVMGNYMDELLNILLAQYFIESNAEKRRKFRDVFIEKTRIDFEKKLNLLKSLNLIPPLLNKIIKDMNAMRNAVAHNVDYGRAIAERPTPRIFQVMNVEILKAQFAAIFIHLQDCQHCINYDEESRTSSLQRIDEEIRQEELFRGLNLQ